ncbi:MAG: hypothetical protein LBV45_03465 [Xanthomonadaceae bacterium]|nr:hypothetical protein [Xanthomonadaceae bacterium]
MKKVVLIVLPILLLGTVMLAMLNQWHSRKNRQIDEAAVRAHYQETWDLQKRFDAVGLCAQLAEDFEGTDDRYIGHEHVALTLNKSTACAALTELMAEWKRIDDDADAGLPPPTVEFEIRDITISSSGSVATVEHISTLKRGDTALSWTQGTEQLAQQEDGIRSVRAKTMTVLRTVE